MRPWSGQTSSRAASNRGDFYIELQNQGIRTDGGLTQTELNHQLTEVAHRAGLKTIATNDFHYLLQEDAKAQDIMLCIGTGLGGQRYESYEVRERSVYMKTEEEIARGASRFP